jgi:hypothetical protein
MILKTAFYPHLFYMLHVILRVSSVSYPIHQHSSNELSDKSTVYSLGGMNWIILCDGYTFYFSIQGVLRLANYIKFPVFLVGYRYIAGLLFKFRVVLPVGLLTFLSKFLPKYNPLNVIKIVIMKTSKERNHPKCTFFFSVVFYITYLPSCYVIHFPQLYLVFQATFIRRTSGNIMRNFIAVFLLFSPL